MRSPQLRHDSRSPRAGCGGGTSRRASCSQGVRMWVSQCRRRRLRCLAGCKRIAQRAYLCLRRRPRLQRGSVPQPANLCVALGSCATDGPATRICVRGSACWVRLCVWRQGSRCDPRPGLAVHGTLRPRRRHMARSAADARSSKGCCGCGCRRLALHLRWCRPDEPPPTLWGKLRPRPHDLEGPSAHGPGPARLRGRRLGWGRVRPRRRGRDRRP
mmetsp:Transcript_52109/g.145460  ORF Transcript_52109/g.145460 Transcript_52109/m.145460 type:complete len:215 (-) Transcript_52109:553-1197(-)